MEIQRTVPVRLDVPGQRSEDLHQTIEQFNTAVNYTVKHGEDDDGYLILNKSTIHDKVYYNLRDETDLPANLCVRAYTKAVEMMKSTVEDWNRAIAARSPNTTSCPPSTTNGR